VNTYARHTLFTANTRNLPIHTRPYWGCYNLNCQISHDGYFGVTEKYQETVYDGPTKQASN